MDVIDRIRDYVERLEKRGIEVRFEDLAGAASGSCIIEGKPVLLVDRKVTSLDQLEFFESIFTHSEPVQKKRMAG